MDTQPLAHPERVDVTASRQEHFAELLARHHGILRKVTGAWCRLPQDRQDLAQEITAQLWRAFPRYDAQRPFSTWMYRIALNVAISGVRSASARGESVSLDDVGGHEALRIDDDLGSDDGDRQIRALHAVINRQPPLDRALLLLWLDERSQREIGEVLGLSETNVATKLARLKQRIRIQLDAPRAN